MALVSGECTFCEGSGKCEECNGSGTNKHLNSPDPHCTQCSGTGVCLECDGTGKSFLWRARKGNVLIYGITWALGLITFFSSFAFVRNRWILALLLVGWTAFWYVLFYCNSQRRKKAPPSRF